MKQRTMMGVLVMVVLLTVLAVVEMVVVMVMAMGMVMMTTSDFGMKSDIFSFIFGLFIV